MGSGKTIFLMSSYKKGKPLVFGNNSYEFMQFIFQIARISRCGKHYNSKRMSCKKKKERLKSMIFCKREKFYFQKLINLKNQYPT